MEEIKQMIKIRLSNEPKHITHEFINKKELNKFLEEFHIAFHILEWTDSGKGRIYNGIC